MAANSKNIAQFNRNCKISQMQNCIYTYRHRVDGVEVQDAVDKNDTLVFQYDNWQ